VREMNPPDDTPVGNRAVDLCHRKLVTKVAGKLLAAEHFGEPAALILPYLRLIKPCAANFKLFHETAPKSPVRSDNTESQRSIIAMPTPSASYYYPDSRGD